MNADPTEFEEKADPTGFEEKQCARSPLSGLKRWIVSKRQHCLRVREAREQRVQRCFAKTVSNG